jgi:tRNA threonylcarbamoyladenosine biosynthesis protein TsaB
VTLFCLDTTTRAGSMALFREGAVSAQVSTDARSLAERLPVEATAWLEGEGVALADIDVFAVVAGPGSFTGLRVGIAATQGWAFGLGRSVVAVPTLDAVAADAAARDAAAEGALVVPLIDGQRGEVFYAVWDAGQPLIEGGVGRIAVAVAAVAALAAGRPVVAVGDGVSRYAAEVAAAGWAGRPLAAPLAASAVTLAASGRYVASVPHAVQPIYLRAPDAKRPGERASS